MKLHLAIDIGASGGRHVVGWLQNGRLCTKEVYRFDNTLVNRRGSLCWDMDALFNHVLAGMKACCDAGKTPETMAIDTWGVDFVLLDERDKVLGDVVAYRDGRTAQMDAAVEKIIPFEELYARTGIQKQLFNTIYQLMALQKGQPHLLEKAHALLMIPDYLQFLLTGSKKQEYTNATTTGLVHAKKKQWDEKTIEKLGYPGRLFKPLALPGSGLGTLRPEVQTRVGFDCQVLLAASHDTASAYMAVPTQSENTAFLSSGTWSLLGTEMAAPVLAQKAMAANFTNEGGYAYRFRFLKNIMGLWIIQSIRREYGKQYSFAQLEQAARDGPAFPSRINVNDADFLAPESMLEAIRQKCTQTGQAPPATVHEVMHCVYHSLADCYAAAVDELARITGKPLEVLHIVGGGSKDKYLNALTAQKTGLPVCAGPTEGTVLGNLAAQMIACGELSTLQEARHAIAQSFPPKVFLPEEPI